jgi:hypothetical protein
MSAWKELATEREISEFLHLFGSFHDGCIKEAHSWGGHYVDHDLSMAVESWINFRVLFQRQWNDPSAVELVFEGLTELRWKPSPPGYDDILYEAWIYRSNDLIVWADAPPHDAADNLISARRVWWRDASEWMGPDLRLGPNWAPK